MKSSTFIKKVPLLVLTTLLITLQAVAQETTPSNFSIGSREAWTWILFEFLPAMFVAALVLKQKVNGIRTATLFFVALTILVAIIPAIRNQDNNQPLPGIQELSPNAVKGKALFVANGCVGCHAQQIRTWTWTKWGESRPSLAADYADIHRTDVWRNTATLMGTER